MFSADRTLVLDIPLKDCLAAERQCLRAKLTSSFLVSTLLLRVVNSMHLPFLLCLGLWLIVWIWPLIIFQLQKQRLELIYRSSCLPTLELNEYEITGSVALLHGQMRKEMIKRKQAQFTISWDAVSSIVAQPAVKSVRNYKPAVLSIIIKDEYADAGDYCILREPIAEFEDQIMRCATKMSGAQVRQLSGVTVQPSAQTRVRKPVRQPA